MTLAEFMKKRREELGLSWNDIIDGGIANNTWCNVVNGQQLTVKAATMERLARLLKCTIGELQACMAETPNPLRAEAARPEGNAGISITAKAKKKPKPEAPAPDPEEPAEVFRPEEPTDELFPVYHSPYDAEREEGAKEYRQKLRDMVLRVMASGRAGEDTLGDVYTDIGIALVKELVSYDE